MFRILRIVGESMSPEINDGDYVVLATSPLFLRRLRPGMVVVFWHPRHGQLIKRIARVDPAAGIFVVGSHKHSLGSQQLGWIPPAAILGRVIWHIRAPARGKKAVK